MKSKINNEEGLKKIDKYFTQQVSILLKEIKENDLKIEDVVTFSGLTPKEANKTLTLEKPCISDIYDMKDAIELLKTKRR